VVGQFPASHFASGVDKQLVTVDAYGGDSGASRWTVANARFFAIGGSDRAVLEQVQRACGIPMLKGSNWQVRQDFRGLLHFDDEGYTIVYMYNVWKPTFLS
jgi:hypothetical protein